MRVLIGGTCVLSLCLWNVNGLSGLQKRREGRLFGTYANEQSCVFSRNINKKF